MKMDVQYFFPVLDVDRESRFMVLFFIGRSWCLQMLELDS